MVKKHQTAISGLAREARELGVLSAADDAEIFGRDSIVCNSKSSTGTSVRSLFRRTGEWLAQEEAAADGLSGPGEHLRAVRTLLQKTLTLHARIEEERTKSRHSHDPDAFKEEYMEGLQSLDEYCRICGIPSILPYLYDAYGLEKALQRPEWNHRLPGRADMYRRIAWVFRFRDHHVKVLVEAMEEQGGHDAAMDLLDMAARNRQGGDRTLMARMPLLARMRASDAMAQGDYLLALTIAEGTNEQLKNLPIAMICLRCLTETGQYGRARRFASVVESSVSKDPEFRALAARIPKGPPIY